jgi:hypothetical protein
MPWSVIIMVSMISSINSKLNVSLIYGLSSLISDTRIEQDICTIKEKKKLISVYEKWIARLYTYTEPFFLFGRLRSGALRPGILLSFIPLPPGPRVMNRLLVPPDIFPIQDLKIIPMWVEKQRVWQSVAYRQSLKWVNELCFDLLFFQILFGLSAPADEGKDALCRNGNVYSLGCSDKVY